MRRYLRGSLVGLVLLVLSGCSWTNNSPAEVEFVQAVDRMEKLIGPRYAGYVNSDPTLAPESKEERLKTVADFRALIDQRKAHLEGQ